ncbi:hypothetical protein C8F04DRAFT_1300736 [Mycena alexandri]|uniref:Uncharacterized protein n=1 Tax=Mycena alexandri TaxID=1745969 RepID=A0AAD6SDR5_9AGAR|nr:hypothetical protein C8F04DRAFT_1300736 [Mycena alexandri]
MLFWILLVHLVRQSGLNQGHPDLVSRAQTDVSCDCTINTCRTLFDIVWGCLVTIFACTWVALHQNVPDPQLGWHALLLRKLQMMAVMILAPEAIVAFACRQLISALWISKEFTISKTHGFFCTMGGFVMPEGHPVADARQFPAYISAIRDVNEADIMDHSKGDALAKSVAFGQALWFMTQCLIRITHSLPITQLEVATLAFAILSAFIRLLWWWKPLDVQRPIMVARSNAEFDPLQAENPTTTTYKADLLDNFFGLLTGGYVKYSPVSSTSVPSFYSTEVVSSDFPTLAALFFTGTIFGGIHCVAWRTLFPSAAEMWIWRMGSLVITGYPVLALLLGLGVEILRVREDILVAFFFFGLVVYLICRTILVVLSFTTLRALPPSIFVDVDWNKYFPHL